MKVESLRSGDTAPADPPLPYRALENITTTRRGAPGAPPSYFIKTPKNEVLEFGQEEYALWRLLDGENSFAEIQAKFAEQFGTQVSRQQFDEFLSDLLSCGIIEAVTPTVADERPALPAPAAASGEPVAREPEAPPPAARTRRGISPAPMLRALAWLGGPLRRFTWLLWPSVTVAVVGFGLQIGIAWREILAIDPITGLWLLAVGLIVTGLVPRIAQAAVAAFYGAPSERWRVAIERRLPPVQLRFDNAPFEALRARGITTATAAPLLARLVLVAGGLLLWLADHVSGNLVSTEALVIGQLALLSFLVSSSPLFRTDGRKWLVATLAEPVSRREEIRNRRHLAVAGWLWWLAVLAILAVYAGLAVPLLPLPASIGGALAGALPMVGMVLAAGVAVVTRPWLHSVAHSQPRIAYRGFPAGRDDEPGSLATGGVVVPFDRDAVPAILPTYRPVVPIERSLVPIIVAAVVVALLESVAFVSYPYEAGGSFTILPYDSAQLNARVAGELTEVLVNEGDQVVPDQVLGILSDWQQKYNLTVSKAQLQNAEANLQHLLESPRPEDVELARKQYDAATARLPYDKAQFDRYAALVGSDVVSRSNYDQVLSQYQQDQAAAAVARANYDQVRSGPTPAQIEAARAQVRQYAATVAYNEDELARTRIRATAAGKVVTPNPMLLRGKWFAQGAPVLTVEDHRQVQADVQVPESDIGNVRFGGAVRLRLWGYPDTTFLGKAVALAPDAQTPQNSTTNVIRVRTEVPNPADLLHPNMSGYAKMTGLYMPTWNAFTQMIERFVLVTIWSWIP
jgi:putative peptide zinc metalloprotease protein